MMFNITNTVCEADRALHDVSHYKHYVCEADRPLYGVSHYKHGV